MKKLLIIDDDTESLETLAELLRGEFEPVLASSGVEGIRAAIHGQPVAILLDVNMPEMDGYEVCRRLRAQPSTRQIPIIMLTNMSELDAMLKGFDAGADDHIAKPFHVRELIARLHARLRRAQLDPGQAIHVGNLEMDPKSFDVRVGGKPVGLTQMEFELLRYFVEHPNEVINRNQLLGDLWPSAVVTDRTVDTHVANLRRKIKGFTSGIQTVYGAGYILRERAG